MTSTKLKHLTVLGATLLCCATLSACGGDKAEAKPSEPKVVNQADAKAHKKAVIGEWVNYTVEYSEKKDKAVITEKKMTVKKDTFIVGKGKKKAYTLDAQGNMTVETSKGTKNYVVDYANNMMDRDGDAMYKVGTKQAEEAKKNAEACLKEVNRTVTSTTKLMDEANFRLSDEFVKGVQGTWEKDGQTLTFKDRSYTFKQGNSEYTGSLSFIGSTGAWLFDLGELNEDGLKSLNLDSYFNKMKSQSTDGGKTIPLFMQGNEMWLYLKGNAPDENYALPHSFTKDFRTNLDGSWTKVG